jgi:cyclophilin family peptidyl-prolyl cis-trans isomerase
MLKLLRNACFVIVLLLAAACKKTDADLVIKTTKGDLYIKLYDDTPLHKANFTKLAKAGFYDGVAFHRIIKNFMIQAGDPKSKDENYKGKLGTGQAEATLAPEFRSNHIHKRGALAAARQNEDVNPERRSNETQFFIVHGAPYTDAGLDSIEAQITLRNGMQAFQRELQTPAYAWVWQAVKESEQVAKKDPRKAQIQQQQLQDSLVAIQRVWMEKQPPFKYTPEQRQAYKEQGGAAWLDLNYTVFGEVVDGFDTIDRIAHADMIPDSERPAERIEIVSIKLLKEVQ